MRLLTKIIKNIFLIGIIFCAIYYYNDIKNYFIKMIDDYSYKQELKSIKIPETKEYQLNYNFNYVQSTNNFIPNNINEIRNIIYTVLNNGWTKFTFMCPKEYKNCSNDALLITNDNLALSDINSFAHPFNSFKTLSTTYNTNGKFTINIQKNYDKSIIEQINFKIDNIINSNINNSMTDRQKIKTIHDYIINSSKYDENYANGIKKYSANTAFGPLFQGYAICSGYTDLMALFLNKFNIPNYKIASERHIWNLVYIENKWYHLDLTFDDPVTDTGVDVLSDDYFLINTSQLHSLDREEHTFNSSIYSEAE